MPVIKNKVSIFPVKDYVYEVDNNIKNIILCRKYRHLGPNIKQPIFTKQEKEWTICIDLKNNTEEEIKGKFRSNFRSDIKKAGQLGIQCMSGKYLNEFYPLYLILCANTKLSALPRATFDSLDENTIFSIAILENEILCAHCHIFNEERNYARLFASASNRFNDLSKSNLVGAANKLLTLEDLIYFKNQGFHTYDFGGYALNTKDTHLAGINRFKEGFGGEISTLYAYSTLPYFVLQKLSSLKDKLLKKR